MSTRAKSPPPLRGPRRRRGAEPRIHPSAASGGDAGPHEAGWAGALARRARRRYAARAAGAERNRGSTRAQRVVGTRVPAGRV
jgi:hypothetical protein